MLWDGRGSLFHDQKWTEGGRGRWVPVSWCNNGNQTTAPWTEWEIQLKILHSRRQHVQTLQTWNHWHSTGYLANFLLEKKRKKIKENLNVWTDLRGIWIQHNLNLNESLGYMNTGYINEFISPDEVSERRGVWNQPPTGCTHSHLCGQCLSFYTVSGLKRFLKMTFETRYWKAMTEAV